MSAPEQSFTHGVQVRWSDVDRLSIVNHARIVEYLTEARAAFLAVDGLGSSSVLRQLSMEFFRPLVVNGDSGDSEDSRNEVPVSVTVRKIGTSSVTVTQNVWDRDGELCLTADVVFVAIDTQTGTSRPLTPRERAHLERYADPAPPG